MGIPSYYKTLITKIPHAIKRKSPNGTATLVIDMNCMIYHVLREPKMVAIQYPGEQGRLEWERKLHGEVSSYLTHIWRSAGSPCQVYVALDGVVPYAKIKQQRFRRFKSAALASNSNTKDETWGLDSPSPIWDTNSITPGTQFMASMGNSLKEAGKKHGWVISDTDEPGEGEHKVLQWLLKTQLNEGPVVVYGLDADLILLCLIAGDKLGTKYPIFLLREAMAFGKLVRLQGSDEVDLCFFQISTLKESLERGTEWTREQFYDYIFGMSFCGNDFLPTGLSLRIRDDGHSILLSCLNDMWKRNEHLVIIDEDATIRPNAHGLKNLAIWMSKQEERLVLTTIRRKMTARPGEDEADNIAIMEQAEKPMIQVVNGDNVILRRDWHSTYCKLALGEDSIDKRKARVSDYWRGWCWILDYYQGRRVDLEWVYPEGYPPTWQDLVCFFELPANDDWALREPLKPQEQLALVLPISSWGLLLKTPFRDLPAKMPQYWPQGFGFETFAKRFGWECEPMIPMLTPARLRYEKSSN
jgi:5'-3' exonuclease